MTPDGVETEHFILRRWRGDDARQLAVGCAQPEVMRYFLDGRCLSLTEVERLVDAFEQHWARHGFGLWAAVAKDTGRCVGYAGLALAEFLPGFEADVEVGWRLEQGHASRRHEVELGAASLTWAFAHLPAQRVISVCQAAHEAWRYVVDRLGMTHLASPLQDIGGDPDPASVTRVAMSAAQPRLVKLEVVEIRRQRWAQARRDLADPDPGG